MVISLRNWVFGSSVSVHYHPKDPSYSRFFNGFRWVFNPFTTGYSEKRDYLKPAFFIAVQLFFTFCFISMLIALGSTAACVLCLTYDYQVLIFKALDGLL